jgi:phosphoglycolate phosphatase
MPRFSHLIFDLDGTLVDSKADLAAATNIMLASFGLMPCSIEQVTSYIGDGARVLVERALGPEHAHLVPHGFPVFMEYYLAHLLDHTRPYAGIPQLLSAAQAQGTILSVLTNKPEAPSRSILAGVDLAPYFHAVIGGDTISVKKPDPHGVFHLQELSAVAREATLLIGDPRIDVETGRAAGIATCGVMWGYGAQGLMTTLPDFVVDSVEELRHLVAPDKTGGCRL